MEDWLSAVAAGKQNFQGTECLPNGQSRPRVRKMQRGYRRKPTRGTQATHFEKSESSTAKTLKRKEISSTNSSIDCQRRRSNRSLNRAHFPNKDQNKGSISQYIIKDENSEFSSEVDDFFEIEIASGCGSTAGQRVVFDPFGDADPLSINFEFFDNSPQAAYAQAQSSRLDLINVGDDDLGEGFRGSNRTTRALRVPEDLGGTSLVPTHETSNLAIAAPLVRDLHASHRHKASRLLQKRELLAINMHSYCYITPQIRASESVHSANQQIVIKAEGVVTRWQRRLDAMSQWNYVFEKAGSDPDDENALTSAMDIVVPRLQKARLEARAAKEEHDQSTPKLETLRQELQKVEERRPILEAEVQEMRAYSEALKKLIP